MTRIRLLKPYGTKVAGDVIEAYPQSAATLRSSGIAEEVKDDGNIEDDSGSENSGIERVGESDTVSPDKGASIPTDRDQSPDTRTRERRGWVK